MTYTVALLNFEGPLDLLLQLVERSRVEVSELSLADLTEQYMSHIAQLETINPHDAAQFTSLAARLLYLKSRGLLPQPSIEDDEDVADLQRQLEAYSAYRGAAAALAELITSGRRGLSRAQSSQPAEPAAPSNLTETAIMNAYRSALSYVESEHTVAAPSVSLADMTRRLKSFSRSGDTLQTFFSGLSSKLEVVVALLAALELWRQGVLQLTQSGQFSIIQIDARTSATA